jgi:hypothetical protein
MSVDGLALPRGDGYFDNTNALVFKQHTMVAGSGGNRIQGCRPGATSLVTRSRRRPGLIAADANGNGNDQNSRDS